ncbi:magnesium chelatase domain-containing protein [Nocardia ninae]
MSRAVAWSVTLESPVAQPFSVNATLGIPPPTETGHTDLAPQCRDRVRATLLNSAEHWPPVEVQLSISGAPQPTGIADLAVAVSVLAAVGEFRSTPLEKILFVAELGLDGALRAVEGTWAAFDAAPLLGITYAVVPQSLLPEFGASTEFLVLGAPTLSAVLAWLRGTSALPCAGTHRWST